MKRYSGYQSQATFNEKKSLEQNLSFGGRQSTAPPCRQCTKFTSKSEIFSGPLVTIIILLLACKASSLTQKLRPWNLYMKLFQRPIARMNEPASKQINLHANKFCLHVFFLGLLTEQNLIL